jgi:hypothetical protein
MEPSLVMSARPHDGVAQSGHPAALRVVAWLEPKVDEFGIDARSHYVEIFWLPVLGPTATWLVRRIADRLETDREGFDLQLHDTARSLGLKTSDQAHAPLRLAIDRCVRYGLALRVDDCGLSVRRFVPLVPRRLLIRLPTSIQEMHRSWGTDEPEPDEGVRLRRRARLIALDLRDLGVDDACIERHLLRRGVHPATAFDAARWAWSPGNEGDRPYVAGA